MSSEVPDKEVLQSEAPRVHHEAKEIVSARRKKNAGKSKRGTEKPSKRQAIQNKSRLIRDEIEKKELRKNEGILEARKILGENAKNYIVQCVNNSVGKPYVVAVKKKLTYGNSNAELNTEDQVRINCLARNARFIRKFSESGFKEYTGSTG